MRDQLTVITGMSFPGAYHRDEDRDATRDNPLWPDMVAWDIERYPRVPIVNIGPFARDYHRFVERGETACSFTVLPEIVDEVARTVLARWS